MQIPLQISFENAEPSEAVRAAIGHEVERLEKYQHRITGCRDAFDRLSVGSEVRFAEELGEKGAQASTVHLIGKHHLSEQNHRR